MILLHKRINISLVDTVTSDTHACLFMIPVCVSHISHMATLLLFSFHHPSCKTWSFPELGAGLYMGSQRRSTSGTCCNWCCTKAVLGSSPYLSSVPRSVATELTSWGNVQLAHFSPMGNDWDCSGTISWVAFLCLSWRCVHSELFLQRMYTT